ncbi:MAG: hypothetical protein FWE52_02750 [Alphaproteobacteria bacterium]|nr:hypothetical protein [Alphaproteobacteria bacterium]
MLKAKIIIAAIKAFLWIALIGVGIWYLSSSIGGGTISYVSLESFLRATGACQDGICDIAASNGCFLCPYIEQLFFTIGVAAESFWMAIIDHIWILLSLGFVIFLFHHTYKYLQEQNAATAQMKADERKFEFGKWFDKVWRQGVRILVVGVIIGAIGYGGTTAIKVVADVTITPVMFIGSEMAMMATGVADSAQCGSGIQMPAGDVMGPAMRPFMCAIGNLNTVILAGAAGGFALMNYAWMGMGGGMFTWLSGLALVIMFLFIGFNIFFKVLTVVFQLVFLIIFLPLIIAAWAFEKEWKLLGGVMSNAIGMLVRCAVRIIAITLQILIVYAMVVFAADEYFPGPRDGYSAILPPGIAMNLSATDTALVGERTVSVMEVFSKCEHASMLESGGVDKDAFVACFNYEKIQVERQHPGAFDFMRNGWEFLILMLGLFFVYWYVIRDKIDGMLGGKGIFGDEGGDFDYGKSVRDFGGALWKAPRQILDNIGKAMAKK